LYVDGHVSWEKSADCSLNQDNIYTAMTDPPEPPTVYSSYPTNNIDDSLLVNE